MTGNEPEVAVLLCTFNGGDFLAEQLESLRRQQGVSVRLFVSDDGSTDSTLEILRAARQTGGFASIEIRRGPSAGSAQNFLSLVCDEAISAEYYCYADQDDIWDSDKLATAIAQLGRFDPGTAVLYCARTRSLSESGALIGYSPRFKRKASFANALVQNIGGGNTMVMNHPAREILRRAGRPAVVSHDWWSYLIISGAGGIVVYDPQPRVSYRQHAGNQIGANTGFRRRMERYLGALRGRNRRWADRNIAALEECSELLAGDSLALLVAFKEWRQKGLLRRLVGLLRSGLYAQTAWGNLGLLSATILKKI